MEPSVLAQTFIQEIWNRRDFKQLDQLLHPDFKDLSLHGMLPPDRSGTEKWIINTGLAFEHETIVEEQVTEDDKAMLKIQLRLKHIGVWRNISPTGISVVTNGYRFFRFKDGKIIEHNALIDGEHIERELKQASHGCSVAN